MTKEELKTLGEKFIELSDMFLRFIERNGLDETKVDMFEDRDTRKEEVSLCKTPLCHGGWLAVMFEQENIMQHVGIFESCFYEKGSTQVAEFLGFAGVKELEDWAVTNPGLWGNDFGGAMFCDEVAFGNLDVLTLKDIANHYREVGEYCIEESKI